MIKHASKIVFLFLLALLAVIPQPALARNSQFRGSRILVPSNQVITHDYFAGGSTVTLSGRVIGDAYLAGGTVTIDGTVQGDVLAVGGDINVTGNISQDLRVVGGSVTIDGRVGRNVSVVGGTVAVSKNAFIAGSVSGVLGSLDHLGNIAGNINISGGNASLNGKIEGNVEARVGTLEVGKEANILGNLTYVSQKEAVIAPTARIDGKVAYTPIAADSYLPTGENLKSLIWSSFLKIKATILIVSFIASFVIGFWAIKLFPRRFAHKVEILKNKPVQSIGIGFVSVTTSLIAAVVLMFTIIGIPLALSLLFLLGVVAYFAKIVVALAVGKIILKRLEAKERVGWALFLGLVLYYLAGLIPFLGWLIKLVVILAGVGAIVLDIKYFYNTLMVKKIA